MFASRSARCGFHARQSLAYAVATQELGGLVGRARRIVAEDVPRAAQRALLVDDAFFLAMEEAGRVAAAAHLVDPIGLQAKLAAVSGVPAPLPVSPRAALLRPGDETMSVGREIAAAILPFPCPAGIKRLKCPG